MRLRLLNLRDVRVVIGRLVLSNLTVLPQLHREYAGTLGTAKMGNTLTAKAVTDSETISSRTIVDLGAVSHRGRVRPKNEDSFLISRFGRSMRTLISNLPPDDAPGLHAEIGYAMLVADGMGGASAGEIASRKAISALMEMVIQTPDWMLRLDDQTTDEVLRRIEERVGNLTAALTELANTNPKLYGMGTTLTLAVSLGPDIVVAHVGDSRAYLFSQDQLVRLTRDHTIAQTLADLGVIGLQDLPRHPARHLLTNAITANGKRAQVELHHLRLADGDRLLLCTDGLTEMVSETEILRLLKRQKSATESCHALLHLALEAGGLDNVTLILADYRVAPEILLH